MHNMSLRVNGEGPKSLRLTVLDLFIVLYLQGEKTPIIQFFEIYVFSDRIKDPLRERFCVDISFRFRQVSDTRFSVCGEITQ